MMLREIDAAREAGESWAVFSVWAWGLVPELGVMRARRTVLQVG